MSVIIGAFCAFFWFWMLLDCLLFNPSLERGQRLLWAVLIAFLPILGALVYFVFAKSGDSHAR